MAQSLPSVGVDTNSGRGDDLCIGPRLRREREARRIGLAEVALRTGLTKSFLSKVERDQASPSLASLLSICRAVGVDISALLATPQTRLTRACDRVTIDGLPGASVVDTLITPRTQRHLTIVETAAGPGGNSGSELYSLASEYEVVFVLEGSIEINVEGEMYRLDVGDALSFGAGIPHSWRNASDIDGARFLAIMAPALPDAALPDHRVADPSISHQAGTAEAEVSK
jgi:quercetin dioxygenase-like cupin family protein/DNA-binding XRE family transcriptional regulator